MTIQTNTEDRKAMVQQISEHLRLEAHYQGIPTYSYTIGPLTVARDGSITSEDVELLAALKPFLLEKGYIEQETDMLAIAIPTEDMNTNQLRNLIHMLYSYQHLLNRVTRQETFLISDAVIERLGGNLPETTDEFETLMYVFKASGDLTGIDFRDNTVSLTFPLDQSPEKNKAYADLTSAVAKAARIARRVTAIEHRPDSEKYALYAWLQRLDMKGVDFKATRDALLDGLTGYAAFRNDEVATKFKEKYAEIRRIGRELREGEVR